MTGPATAVVTIAHGRHEHLRGQGWGLARQTRPPRHYVVVAMGDDHVAAVTHEAHPSAEVVELDADPPELPLARARNLGAARALADGAEVLVFLDVDCIPAPTLVERYAAVLAEERGSRPRVACGEVRYLPPVPHSRDYRTPALTDLAEPHPARPVPPSDGVLRGDVRLFWSLSFAVTARDWAALDGFDEAYSGYGAEDTDFGQRLAAAGGELLWVGDAAAYHQHHPTETPPVRHLHSIVRNANLFRDRWGWFPMEGWLSEFAARGLARLDHGAGRWQVLP